MLEETHRLANSGRLDEAVAALGTGPATEREVLGGLHEDVVTALALLSQIHEGRGDWKAARAASRRVSPSASGSRTVTSGASPTSDGPTSISTGVPK